MLDALQPKRVIDAQTASRWDRDQAWPQAVRLRWFRPFKARDTGAASTRKAAMQATALARHSRSAFSSGATYPYSRHAIAV